MCVCVCVCMCVCVLCVCVCVCVCVLCVCDTQTLTHTHTHTCILYVYICMYISFVGLRTLEEVFLLCCFFLSFSLCMDTCLAVFFFFKKGPRRMFDARHVYVCVNICVFVCMCISVYVCMCVCMCVCMSVCVCVSLLNFFSSSFLFLVCFSFCQTAP